MIKIRGEGALAYHASLNIRFGNLEDFDVLVSRDEERYLESKGRRTNSAIQGSCTRAIGQSGSECLTTRGFENTTRIVMREKRKRPEMDQLSSMTSTVAGPGMKSLSSSTTELRRRRDLPPATTGAVCPQTRANTLFQALRKQQNMSEVQCPSICAPFRPPRCHTVVVLAITHEEIGTKMTLTEFANTCYRKTQQKRFPITSPHPVRGHPLHPVSFQSISIDSHSAQRKKSPQTLI